MTKCFVVVYFSMLVGGLLSCVSRCLSLVVSFFGGGEHLWCWLSGRVFSVEEGLKFRLLFLAAVFSVGITFYVPCLIPGCDVLW